jgi:cytochrome c peroxidase
MTGSSVDPIQKSMHLVYERRASQEATRHGDPARGQALFNGKGICFYCHGTDGDLSNPPQLSTETAKIIDHLDPKPSDLRSPRRLKLTTDRERFKAICEGHAGTAMLPDKGLTDEEIVHLVANLSLLRGE